MRLKVFLIPICCMTVNFALCDELRSEYPAIVCVENVVEAVAAAKPYLTCDLFTVINKAAIPPSGDKRDYVSMSNYYWPDPESPTGYPYIYRDGEYNPESSELYTDCATFRQMTDAVSALGKAYHYTHDDRYANRVEDIIDYFFINETTMMKPHLTWAKIIPQGLGVITDGNCFGILETSSIQFMLKAIESVSKSDAWSDNVDSELNEWVGEFQNWLATSNLGQKEMTRQNNHGTHFDAQYLSLLIYLNKKDEAVRHFSEVTLPRIEQQVAKDGSQPNELRRTKSWNYCMMNLKGWMRLADYADRVGVDLWHYSKDGQIYIKSMIDWYIPYLTQAKSWKWKQIIPGHLDGMVEILERAAEIYNDESYLEIINDLKPLKGGIIR